jgi:hypothetical protein
LIIDNTNNSGADNGNEEIGNTERKDKHYLGKN